MPWYADLCHGWPRAKHNPGMWTDEGVECTFVLHYITYPFPTLPCPALLLPLLHTTHSLKNHLTTQIYGTSPTPPQTPIHTPATPNNALQHNTSLPRSLRNQATHHRHTTRLRPWRQQQPGPRLRSCLAATGIVGGISGVWRKVIRDKFLCTGLVVGKRRLWT